MPKTIINAASWSRIPINGLSIVPSLAGAAHVFPFEGKPVEVRLPPRPKRQRVSTGSWGNDRIWCSSWRTVSRRPLCFEVQSVDIFVDLKRPLSVPVESLGHANPDHFSPRENSRFAGLAKRGDILATGALNRWLRTLRWKSLRPYIGRPQIWFGPVHGVYLVDYHSKRRFYGLQFRWWSRLRRRYPRLCGAELEPLWPKGWSRRYGSTSSLRANTGFHPVISVAESFTSPSPRNRFCEKYLPKSMQRRGLPRSFERC